MFSFCLTINAFDGGMGVSQHSEPEIRWWIIVSDLKSSILDVFFDTQHHPTFWEPLQCVGDEMCMLQCGARAAPHQL